MFYSTLSPCFWLAFGLLSWGYLVFSNIIDLCCTTFMLSLLPRLAVILVVGSWIDGIIFALCIVKFAFLRINQSF